MFLDHIKSEQQDLQAVKEAYHELHQKHTELSSQAEVQHIYELEVQTHVYRSLCVTKTRTNRLTQRQNCSVTF